MTDDINALFKRFSFYSGFILFIYAIMHLLNHSINIISLDSASYVKENYFQLIWKSWPGTILLYGSLLVHIPLGLLAILTRKSFKITAREWLQIIFIILATFVFVQHVASMYIATRTFDSVLPYSALYSMVLAVPEDTVASMVLYSLMSVFIWVHGCIGIHTALKYRMEGYANNIGKFYTLYFAVPILGMFGFWAGFKEQSLLTTFNIQSGNDQYLFSVILETLPAEAFPVLQMVEPLTLKYWPLFLLVLVLITIANVVRTKYFGRVKITYPNNVVVNVPKGTTVLEASRSAGIPHKSVCGGRGRCTTCRVKVSGENVTASNMSVYEKRALEKAGLDPSIRLACQLKPHSNVTITPLLNPESEFDVIGKSRELSGKEQNTVILFVDLRNFTKLSETTLPYDVVYILNRYYATCGRAIENNSGRLDKFIGDGVMAIFEAAETVEENCRNAVKAASKISEQMKVLGKELKVEFSADVKCGMGIHTGQSIVGMMGYGEAFSRTAIGDNVNVASRLEQMTKAYSSELVISKLVAEKANIDISKFTSEAVEVRGRDQKMDVVSISDASSLQIP